MSRFNTSPDISGRMSRIHSASTKPEIMLRHALWHRGFRYRKNVRHLPGSPDIVLPKYRTVIFVHGCFWHGHKGCKNYTTPKTNTDFWTAKIARNQARDQEVWRQLEAVGWSVIVVWECELSKKNRDATITRIEADLQAAKEKYDKWTDLRRENREFARLQAKKHRENLARVETELNRPKSLRRYAKKALEEE